MTDQSRLQLTDAHIEKMLAQRAGAGAPADLVPLITAAVESTGQRAPGLLGGMSGPSAPRTRRGPRRMWLLVAATLAIGAGVAGVSLAGGQLVVPTPTPTTAALVTNPTAVPSPSAVQPAAGLIAFADHGGFGPKVWVANADGTGKHELIPGGCQGWPSWSPDGTLLLISRIEHPVNLIDEDPCGFFTNLGDAGTRLYLTDASGSTPQLVDTGCVDPCVSDSRGVFSSDGRRILFVRLNAIVDPSAAPGIAGKPAPRTQVGLLAEMDLPSGRVRELTELSRSSSPYPRWSPDRTQFVFDEEIPGVDAASHFTSVMEVLISDADGRNVHTLSPSGQFSAWSPDGSRILFQGERYTWVGDVSSFFSDIYTIRPDGTDLRRLTTDERSTNPAWSVDGRIFFIRAGSGATTTSWIMDADGGAAAQPGHAPQPQELADTARQPTP